MKLKTRWQNVTCWILQVLLALLFLLQAVLKLTNSPNWVSRFRHWGYPEHFYLLVGVLELAGAVALLVPRAVVGGALVLLAVMLAAALTHVIHHEPQVITTLVISTLLVFVVYVRRSPAARVNRATQPDSQL